MQHVPGNLLSNGYVAVSQSPRAFGMHFGIARGQANILEFYKVYKYSYIRRSKAKFTLKFMNIHEMSCTLTGRREVNVRRDGNCFYRAMALAVSGTTDEAHKFFRAVCNEMIAEYPEVF